MDNILDIISDEQEMNPHHFATRCNISHDLISFVSQGSDFPNEKKLGLRWLSNPNDVNFRVPVASFRREFESEPTALTPRASQLIEDSAARSRGFDRDNSQPQHGDMRGLGVSI